MTYQKNQKYSQGTDSPGGTAGIIAKSYQIQRDFGYDNIDSCEIVFQQYQNHFDSMGYHVPLSVQENLLEVVKGDLVLTTFAIFCLFHVPVEGNLEVIYHDMEIIVEVIAETQRTFLKNKQIGNPLPLEKAEDVFDICGIFRLNYYNF